MIHVLDVLSIRYTTIYIEKWNRCILNFIKFNLCFDNSLSLGLESFLHNTDPFHLHIAVNYQNIAMCVCHLQITVDHIFYSHVDCQFNGIQAHDKRSKCTYIWRSSASMKNTKDSCVRNWSSAIMWSILSFYLNMFTFWYCDSIKISLIKVTEKNRSMQLISFLSTIKVA